MPLSSKDYDAEPMTKAINLLPPTSSTIRESGLFQAEYLDTTSVDVSLTQDEVLLVESQPRGTPGDPVKDKKHSSKNFKMLHLPKDDIVRADDVQNKRADATAKEKRETVSGKVNKKLAKMKRDIEYTREHLQLGAVRGKIIDGDKSTVLVDVYKEFGLKRKTHDIKVSNDSTEVGMILDDILLSMEDDAAGELISGWRIYASKEFMQGIIWHPTMKAIYQRFQDAGIYRDSKTRVSFKHGNTEFVHYSHKFGSEADIKPGEAAIVPVGTRETFFEFFAPADMEEFVNKEAKPYYASRARIKHSKGWDVHAQSNPLPLMVRPNLGATLTIS